MAKKKFHIFDLIIFSVLGLAIILAVVFFKQKPVSNNSKNDISNETSNTTIKDNPSLSVSEILNNSTNTSTNDSKINDSNAKKEPAKQIDIYAEKYEKAFSLFFSNDYEKSIAIADEILAENPKYYMAYNIKGIAICYNGNFEEGMKNINKSLELKSDFPYGLFNKALALELFGYYDEALKAYDAALEVDRSNTWIYYGIASIYGRYGDVENTIKYMAEAINLDPKVKDEAKTESDFDNVRSSTKFNELLNS